MRLASAIGAEGTRRERFGLSGVGSDDLQIRLRAQREQRVMAAQPDVPASGLGPGRGHDTGAAVTCAFTAMARI